MIRRITCTAFNAAVVLAAVTVAVWLIMTGHIFQIGGLLLVIGAILGAVIYGFRLAEGFGPDRLSIWAGPVWSIRPAEPAPGENGDGMREAA